MFLFPPFFSLGKQQGIPDEEFEDLSDDDSSTESKSVIPPALALLMNATKFFSEAPGIIIFFFQIKERF